MSLKLKTPTNNPRFFDYLKNSSFIICLYFGTTNLLWLDAKSRIAPFGGKLYIGGKHLFKHKKKKIIKPLIQGSFCIIFLPTKTKQWNFITSFIEKNKHFHILGGRRKDVPFFASKKITKIIPGNSLLRTVQSSHNNILSLLFYNLIK